MTASPLFRERFQSTLYDKLHEVQQLQLLEQQRQQQSLCHTGEDHGVSTRAPSNTTSSVPIEQSTSAPESSSTSCSSSLSPAALLSDSYTNVTMTTANQYPVPTSHDSHITSASNHHDLMDEFNQWIH